MSWATPHIARLRAGETVSFRPRGQSMRPRIESGALCTLAPVEAVLALRVGDVVLCSVRGTHYLHLIKAVNGDRYLIGNNRGGVNGWVGVRCIYGRLVSVETEGSERGRGAPLLSLGLGSFLLGLCRGLGLSKLGLQRRHLSLERGRFRLVARDFRGEGCDRSHGRPCWRDRICPAGADLSPYRTRRGSSSYPSGQEDERAGACQPRAVDGACRVWDACVRVYACLVWTKVCCCVSLPPTPT